MGWFKVDDKFKNHPKAMKAGVEALGFWLMGGCWVAEYETDGFIPDHILPVLPGYKAAYVARLITSGLWELTEGGVKMHDYKDFNPTREQQDEKRAQWRDRQNKKRVSHANVTRESPECPGKGKGEDTGGSSTAPVARGSGFVSGDTSNSGSVPLSNSPIPPSVEISTCAREAGNSPEKDCFSTSQNQTVQEPAQQALIPDTGRGTGATKPREPRRPKNPSPTCAAWDAYATAYQRRYGAAPVRNASVNGQLAQLVARLGAEEAPLVAAFYVGHSGAYYVQKGHAVGPLLQDYEKLRMEWATGRRVNAHAARMSEQTEGNPFLAISRKLREEEAADVVEQQED